MQIATNEDFIKLLGLSQVPNIKWVNIQLRPQEPPQVTVGVQPLGCDMQQTTYVLVKANEYLLPSQLG